MAKTTKVWDGSAWQEIAGIPGAVGSDGSDGTNGISAGLKYIIDTTSTSDSDPGAGKVRFNSSTPASITYIYLDESADGNNVDAFIQTWDDSNGSVKGHIIMAIDGTNDIGIFEITGSVVDGTGYWKIPVTVSNSFASLSNGTVVYLQFYRYGNDGADGADGADAPVPSLAIRRTDGTASASTQAVFDSANDAFTVSENKAYSFSGNIRATTAIVSSTSTGITFSLGGTATLSNLRFYYISHPISNGTTQLSGQSTSTSSVVVASSASAQNSVIWINGTFTVGAGAGGTVIPQLDSTDPSTVRANADSWFSFTELGSSTATAYGNGWS